MTVIVGIDGSDESIEALRFAAGEAKLRQVPLRLVHAFEVPITGTWTAQVAFDPAPFEESARQLLDGAILAVGEDLEGVAVVERVVESGPSASVIMQHAYKDDLVVVGSRGRGGFKGLLLGSVSQQVVLHAPCPVVVVRGRSD
jgi:nucleotide-binding universal stress UspA family protein